MRGTFRARGHSTSAPFRQSGRDSLAEIGSGAYPPRVLFSTDARGDEESLARVELRDLDYGPEVSLWVDESYPYLMLFSGDPLPAVRRRSLAVEPMTCPPNAFRTGEALIRLEPGSSFTGTWGIACRKLSKISK
jgi:galactose mutarotase-like enzyme